MITFQQDSTRFTYRVAGVALHNDSVLCEQSYDKTFWHLPGGRAELRESAPETLIREMREELNTPIIVERLLYVVENFFTRDSAFQHLLEFHFLMKLPSDSYLHTHSQPFMRTDNGQQLIFAWLPLAELENILFYPLFLRTGLQFLPEHTVHIIHNDG